MRAITLGVAIALAGGAALAAEPLRDLCPDRPGKGTSACTVDKGHWQLEVDVVDLSRDRGGGLTADSWLFAAPTLKYGVTDRFDLEVGFNGYQRVRVRDRSTGAVTSDGGIGDTYLRGKTLLAGGPLTLAIEPFLKLPTASHRIGNGKVEGGLVAPMAAGLPGGWGLGITAEGDDLENAAGDGHHGAGSLTLGLSHDAPGGINLGVELWAGWDFDPAGHSSQSSLDLSAAWVPPSNGELQLDGGVNFGLNRQTPQAQVYVGVSRRF